MLGVPIVVYDRQSQIIYQENDDGILDTLCLVCHALMALHPFHTMFHARVDKNMKGIISLGMKKNLRNEIFAVIGIKRCLLERMRGEERNSL